MTSESPVERPRTSRGHCSRTSNPLCTSTACEPAGHGAYDAHAHSTTVTSEQIQTESSPRDSEPTGRPKTSHGRKPIVIPTPTDNAEETREEFYNPTAKRRESKVDILRLDDSSSSPSTVMNSSQRRRSHHQQDNMLNMEVTGYRVEDASFHHHSDRTGPVKARHDITLDYSQFANTSQSFGYEGTERPRTSHRRRQRGRATQQSEDFSQGSDIRPYQTGDIMETNNSDNIHTTGDYGHQDFYGASTEPARPSSRRSSVPSGPSYNLTPSPPPYSPTGGSQLRHRARKSVSGPPTQDYYSPYGPPSTPSQSSRPTSAASLSKYPVLPRIGIKVSPRSHDSPPQQAATGNKDMMTVTNTVQTLSLGDGEIQQKQQMADLPKQSKETSGNPSKPQPRKPSGSNTSSTEKPTPTKPILKKKTNPAPQPKPKTNKETSSPKASPQSMLKPLKRNITLPAEPRGKDPKILLAIKLHNGQRVQRNFRPTDPLNVILNFAELSAKVDYSGHELVCGTPRKVFKNLKMQIKDSGLENKTVLHLEYPDE